MSLDAKNDGDPLAAGKPSGRCWTPVPESEILKT